MTDLPVTVERRAPGALGTTEREDWRALAEAIPDATVFMWPAFFEAWHRTIGAGVDCDLLLARRGAELVGVLPVMQCRIRRGPAFVPRIDYGPFDADLGGGLRPFPLRQLSPVVSWRATSIRPTLVCRSADRAEVARALARTLSTTGRVDQIVIPIGEGEEGPWLDGFRAAGLDPWVHELGRSVLTLEEARPFEQILRDRNANFRKNIKRARAAAAEAGLVFRIVRGGEDVRPLMERLAQIAAESWKGRSDGTDRVAIAYEGEQRRVFEALVADPGRGLEPVICLGETAEGPVQMALGFRHGLTLSTLLTFRRDVLASASPGLLGAVALVDWAAAERLRRIDFNATQDWLRFLADTTHRLVNVVVFRPTPRGRLFGPVARWRRRRADAPAT